VHSAIATAYPLDVAAEAKRIAMANGGEKVALADIAESLVRLSLPARVVLFFSEKVRQDPAQAGEVMSKTCLPPSSSGRHCCAMPRPPY